MKQADHAGNAGAPLTASPLTASPLTASIETPSGKGAADENFPVASRLLAPRLRPHIAAFYAFARAADDIADNPDLTPAAKLDRLGAFDRALREGSDDPALSTAARLRGSLAATNTSDTHARDLLRAFMQDAAKSRYQTWDELMEYCALSAAPVGRWLLDLHGEDAAGYAFSDPLCAALQVINHLQDCGGDYREQNRVYLPLDWLAAAGVDETALGSAASTPGLRAALNRCLAGCDSLMVGGRALPRHLTSWRLAAESRIIAGLADALIRQLRRRDPLAERVAFGKPRMILIALTALTRLSRAPAQTPAHPRP